MTECIRGGGFSIFSHQFCANPTSGPEDKWGFNPYRPTLRGLVTDRYVLLHASDD